MNILLWVLQILLALHTVMGAVWKFSNPAGQSVPSLAAIPHGVWISISIFEFFIAVALIIPAFYRPLAILAPVAALCIVAIMLIYCVVHLFSGEANHSPVMYWIVVAAICAFIAYGRFILKPL
jgi:hypothetical protein